MKSSMNPHVIASAESATGVFGAYSLELTFSAVDLIVWNMNLKSTALH
jgi:hypothetical protein